MNVKKITNNQVRFTFEVSVEEFEHGLTYAFDSVKKDVELKGFRKGHVPRNVYETKFGVESLYEDAINHVLHHKYAEARNNAEYEIVGQPNVDVDFAKIKRGEVFEISFTTSIKPEVTLGEYKGIEVKKIDIKVSDAEVDSDIERLLAQNSSLELKEGKAAKGDTAIFDFEGFREGVPFEGGKAENHQLEIGSNQFIPGFEDQMIGMQAKEEKEINVTFPKEYQEKTLAGKEVVFKIVLHEIKTKVTSQLNDEWVKSLAKENIETVEALKVETKTALETKKKQEAENKVADEVIDKVVTAAKVEIPQVMIDDEVNQYKENVKQQAKQYNIEFEMFLSMSGVTPEKFEEQALEHSIKRVKTSLVLEAIAKSEGITATKEELTAKYEELALHYKMPVDEIKKHLGEKLLTTDIKINKGYKFLIDSSVKV